MSNIKDVCCKLAYWSHWHTWIGRRTDGRTYVRTYVRTVDDVMSIKPRFLASMGYHIFLTMVLRGRAPLARAELRYKAGFLHFCNNPNFTHEVAVWRKRHA